MFYSERERQTIIRRGQARRRNKRMCGQMCAHFKEVRKQTWRGQVPGRMEGAPPNNTVYSLPLSLSQERIGIKTRTSLPRLYTLHHLKSGPVTPIKWKHLNEAEEEAQGMEQRSPSANCNCILYRSSLRTFLRHHFSLRERRVKPATEDQQCCRPRLCAASTTPSTSLSSSDTCWSGMNCSQRQKGFTSNTRNHSSMFTNKHKFEKQLLTISENFKDYSLKMVIC